MKENRQTDKQTNRKNEKILKDKETVILRYYDTVEISH